MKKLELDLDSFHDDEYVYTDYDIGGYGHKIIINEIDKENFLDAFAKAYRDRAEEYLEDYNEEDE